MHHCRCTLQQPVCQDKAFALGLHHLRTPSPQTPSNVGVNWFDHVAFFLSSFLMEQKCVRVLDCRDAYI